MRKLLYAVVFGLLTLMPCYAQQGVRSHRFTIAGPDSAINLTNTGIVYHKLIWTVSGTASVCTVALDSSADGTTWSAGGAIAGQTCTSNGTSTIANVVANYVRINMTALTVTAGSSVTVTWDGYTSLPSGGGTVTSITATSPIVVTPSPITNTGVISCPTCGTGSVTGSGSSGQITLWSSASALTSDVSFQYNKALTNFFLVATHPETQSNAAAIISNTGTVDGAATGQITLAISNTLTNNTNNSTLNPAVISATHQFSGTGSWANVFGAIQGQVQNTGAGSATDASAFYARAATNSGGGSITNAYGYYAAAQTVGGTNYGFFSVSSNLDHFGSVLSGTDNSVAGSYTASNGSAAAHTIWGSGATTTNTINGFAAVPTTGRLIDCTVTTTTCLLHDSGLATANIVTSAAALTSNAVVLGAGSQGSKTTTAFTTDGAAVLTVGVAGGGNGSLALAGTTSGTATLTAPGTAGTTTNPVLSSNVIQGPVGAVGTPTFAVGVANSGIWSSGSNAVNVSVNGQEVIRLPSSTAEIHRSDAGIDFAATTTLSGTVDTGISRSAAGVLAIGNSTVGNTTGRVKASAYMSVGTKFTTNNGCTDSATAGGATAGTFTVGSTSCTEIVTMGDTATAPNGWSCTVVDITTLADVTNPHQTTSNTTTATIVTGTVVSGDKIQFSCIGY